MIVAATNSIWERKHFRINTKRISQWPYVYEAVVTPRLRLCSPVTDPWSIPTWFIEMKAIRGIANNVMFTHRVELRLFGDPPLTVEGIIKDGRITYSFLKGIPHTKEPTLRFYTLPLRLPPHADGIITLAVSVFEVPF